MAVQGVQGFFLRHRFHTFGQHLNAQRLPHAGNGGDDGAVEVLCTVAGFEAVKSALQAAGLHPEVAEVTMRPESELELDGEDAARMRKLLDVIEDLDDVQAVYHNAAIDE